MSLRPAPDTMTHLTALLPVAQGVVAPLLPTRVCSGTGPTVSVVEDRYRTLLLSA